VPGSFDVDLYFYHDVRPPRRHGFPLEMSILTLSQVTLMVHTFPIVVHVPLAQMVRCKEL
jgi:hypothetical protein